MFYPCFVSCRKSWPNLWQAADAEIAKPTPVAVPEPVPEPDPEGEDDADSLRSPRRGQDDTGFDAELEEALDAEADAAEADAAEERSGDEHAEAGGIGDD